MAGENKQPAQGQQSPPPAPTQPITETQGSDQAHLQEQIQIRGGCIDKQGFCCGVWPADGCYCNVM
ncbi:hypothetical protein GCG54_00000516 [Colletotrichum gloeosporioides]|uniref:Uncharacterized protein n=1 Tax=Colletotrichum gloeosporioides TaxID=474922 RepID=A0A8H4FJ56_COLGL|nr:uncharacterized protein GCG54_00000516 [Colletotrichum gloeosporioides]KAF3804167.1 hypothetical protein GCG54_00000516 [Colletotrichum gloeosporioides]